MKDACESCSMPFAKDPGIQEDPRYCSLCFRDGKLCYQGDLKGFQARVYTAMRSRGMGALKAKLLTWTIRFAPRWKK